MKIYYNSRFVKLLNLIFNFKTIMLFGFVATAKDTLTLYEQEHEHFHAKQFKDCFFLGTYLTILLMVLFSPIINWYGILFGIIPLLVYYVWYLIEYIINRCKGFSHTNACENIKFEKQANALAKECGLPRNERTPYTFMSWLKY